MHKLICRLWLLLFIFPTSLSAQWTFYTGPYGSATYQVIEEGNTRWLCTSEGLFRSNNGGQQYQRVEELPAGCHIGTAWIQHDSIVVVLSYPGPDVSGPKENFLYWSVNRGASWQSRVTNIQPETVYKGIQYIGDTLIVASVAHLWRSDDDGLTFQEIGPLPGQGVYRAVLSDKALWVSATGGIFRSQDRGESWQLVQPLNSGANIARSGDTLLAVPTNTDSIRVSLDLGDTWQAAPPNAFAQGGFLYAGLNGRFFTAYKPIYYTDDLGQSWQQLTPGSSGNFFGAYENAQGIWGFSNHGLVRVNPADGSLQLEAEGTISSANQYFVKSVDDRLYSFTGDNTWSSSADARHWTTPAKLPGGTSLAYDIYRVGDTLLLLSSSDFYFSTNEGQSWGLMPDSFDNAGTMAIKNGVLLIGDQKGVWRANHVQGPWTKVLPAYWVTAVLPTPDKWYAILYDGSLYTSTDEGLTWLLSALLGIPGNVSSFNLQYAAGKVFYFSKTGLMRTAADDGVNWEPCPGVDPSLFFSGIAEFGELLFLGTYGKGLYVSTDGGLHWLPFNKFEDRYIRTVTLWKNQLLVAVYEEGLWMYELDLLSYPVQAFADDNQNKLRDTGEGPYPGLIVRAKNGAFASSDSSGLVRVLGAAPEDSLFTYPPKFYTTVTPGKLSLTSMLDTPQIAVYKQSVFDLRISLVNLRPLVPGTVTEFHLICENIGSETQDAKVRIQFPPELSYVSALEPPDAWGLDSAAWTLLDFKSGDLRTIHLNLKTAATVIPGELLSVEATIRPDDTDVNIDDNGSGMRMLVRGSYDPNDKTARQGERITPQELADGAPMEYIIRFQNTGNYPATFIRITDTLQAGFDPATFRFLGSSHPCQWELKGAGILEFFFDDIQLPDSISNEPGSHGFVTFSIQPVSGLVLGDTLANTAFIYFDYNAPVQTNTAQTVVSEPLRLATPARDQSPELFCFPNPANHTIQIRWPNTMDKPGGHIWIWDATGRLIWQQADTGSASLLTVPLAGWPAGWYRVGWQNNGLIRWGRFLKN